MFFEGYNDYRDIREILEENKKRLKRKRKSLKEIFNLNCNTSDEYSGLINNNKSANERSKFKLDYLRYPKPSNGNYCSSLIVLLRFIE